MYPWAYIVHKCKTSKVPTASSCYLVGSMFMVLHACPIYESGSTFLLPQWRSPNLKVGLPVWWSNTGKTPWNTLQGLPHLKFSTVYLQVVKLPKETYATDIHWFPPGVSSKKTSNQSDLFVLACTDGQSAVLRVLWLVWEITWLVWEIMWLVWGVMWLVWEVMWLVWEITWLV